MSNFLSRRYLDTRGDPNVFSIIRDVIVAFILIILLMVYWPFRIVPTGHRGVVAKFGEITGVRNEGLVILAPWESLAIFNTRSETAKVDKAEGSTFDTQPVIVSLVVRYSVLPNKVSWVYEQYSHDGDLSSYVNSATQEAFKSVTANYTAPDLIAKRSSVSNDLVIALQKKLDKYGAQVLNVDMTSFSFSQSYMSAINQKVTQEQLKLVAENQLETVKAEQKQKVAIAEAEADSAKARADGEAYANLTVATAKAQAIVVQNKALAENKDVLELLRIEVEKDKANRWDGKLPENIYASAPIPFLNLK